MWKGVLINGPLFFGEKARGKGSLWKAFKGKHKGKAFKRGLKKTFPFI